MLSKSFFLLGSRGTGKSTLLKSVFAKDKVLTLDLLDDEFCHRLMTRPGLILELVGRLQDQWVIIDEVQKIPELLDYVQKLIVEKKIKFALTGSSARKLKRGGANLLGGRALINYLHPLTHLELGSDFELERIINHGSLPEVILSKSQEEAEDTLRAYANTYLKEEIVAEQLIRNLVPFRKFLEVAAQCNGQPINASKMGRDCNVDDTAIQRYYEILEDTLVGFLLPPYHTSFRKRQSHRSKFYFFDLGIRRALDFSLRIPVQEGSYAYGSAFEHFIILELRRLNDYLKRDFRFSYLRTKDDFEVDLVIERPGKPVALVEIKSSRKVDVTEINRLNQFAQKMKRANCFILCQEARARVQRKVVVTPWRDGVAELMEL